MTEEKRNERNRSELRTCHPVFRARLARVLAVLQAQGFRPRIQIAWRSVDEQLAAYLSGHSKLRYGFHNCTAADGTPEALAADVLDDDHPLNPTREYLLALARAARLHRCDTGIDWDLPTVIRAALNKAIEEDRTWDGKIGWDACHVEVIDVTVAQAKAGMRPKAETAERTLNA